MPLKIIRCVGTTQHMHTWRGKLCHGVGKEWSSESTSIHVRKTVSTVQAPICRCRIALHTRADCAPSPRHQNGLDHSFISMVESGIEGGNGRRVCRHHPGTHLVSLSAEICVRVGVLMRVWDLPRGQPSRGCPSRGGCLQASGSPASGPDGR